MALISPWKCFKFSDWSLKVFQWLWLVLKVLQWLWLVPESVTMPLIGPWKCYNASDWCAEWLGGGPDAEAEREHLQGQGQDAGGWGRRRRSALTFEKYFLELRISLPDPDWWLRSRIQPSVSKKNCYQKVNKSQKKFFFQFCYGFRLKSKRCKGRKIIFFCNFLTISVGRIRSEFRRILEPDPVFLISNPQHCFFLLR